MTGENRDSDDEKQKRSDSDRTPGVCGRVSQEEAARRAADPAAGEHRSTAGSQAAVAA
jgi:hypothetical protein